MRSLPTLLAATFLAAVARAEVVRVAVASGSSLTIAGKALVASAGDDRALLVAGPKLTLDAVGPFVCDGERLAPELAISDRSGATVEVEGVTPLGSVRVVATDRALTAVDAVDLETYVASVVGAEMPPSWPAAALEAQAIAARTYVLLKTRTARDLPWDVESGVLAQVYRGAGSLDPRTVAAARATRGEVVTFRGELAETYFFSSCTGRTESARAAFGRGEPYLVPTSCRGGEAAPSARWTRRLPLRRLSGALERAGAIGDALRSVEVTARTSTGRIARARLVTRRGGRAISGAELRRLVGYDVMPSLAATIAVRGSDLVLTGSGSGHAVGLCQWCARGRALAGASAGEILRQAYPGTRVARLR